MLKQLMIVLASTVMLGAGAAHATTTPQTAPVNDATVLLAQEMGDAAESPINEGDTITIAAGTNGFTDGKAYEVQVDQEGDLFVEDDDAETWNIVSVSDDGDEIQLEYDGRVIAGDDVDE
jgi:hypothetical protein